MSQKETKKSNKKQKNSRYKSRVSHKLPKNRGKILQNLKKTQQS